MILIKSNKKKNNYLQIDARPKKEFEKFSLPFSVQCSGGELPVFINNNSNLKKNYIVHCAGRTRSIIAYQTLNDFNLIIKSMLSMEEPKIGFKRISTRIQ